MIIQIGKRKAKSYREEREKRRRRGPGTISEDTNTEDVFTYLKYLDF